MISGLTEEMVNKGGAGYYYNNVYVSSLSGSQHYDIRIDRRDGEQGGAGYYYNNVYVSSPSGSQYYDIRIDRREGDQRWSRLLL